MHEKNLEYPRKDTGVRWRLADVVDFEYFIHDASDEVSGNADRQDREIYLGEVQSLDIGGWKNEAERRRFLFWRWLQARRRLAEAGELNPGTLIEGVYPWIRNMLIFTGLFIGAGAAGVCLQYDGRKPVNVAEYFGVLVMPQIVLSLVALVFFGFRSQRRLFANMSLWQRILQPLIARAVQRIHRQIVERRPLRERNRVRRFFAFWGSRQSLFNAVFYWPLLSLMQAFGVAFNVGVIVATLAMVIFSDRAFGWQSAVQFEAESVHAFVETVAIPWKWAVPDGSGVPTLDEIRGTRIILKDGMSALATERLVSWWPFLCLAVCVYGLVPRVVLMLGSLAAYRWSLRNLNFEYVECDRLFERMTTCSLDTTPSPDPRDGNTTDRGQAGRTLESNEAGPGSCLVLIPLDFLERFDDEVIRKAVFERFNWSICHTRKFREGVAGDQGTFDELRDLKWPDGLARVLILHEAWRPPIDEFITFVRGVRESLSTKARITIGLFGKPLSGASHAPVRESDFRVWKQMIEAVGDPYLRLEKLLPHD
ncbi:MAG: DUF2868 domain-containing protein [Verrucomicrobia bacterium]|nr:DUF2868 domain-containing protein [Verrucomicrobiota bacterium]